MILDDICIDMDDLDKIIYHIYIIMIIYNYINIYVCVRVCWLIVAHVILHPYVNLCKSM
jgi:hypothetical protein